MGTGSAGVDITDKAAVSRFMEQEKPDAVIHCAAYTAVDRAEEEPVLCRRINRDGTQYIADACRDADAVMMYISTDYVFPGTGTVSYDTGNAPDPVNMYGETKWEGEKAVQQSLSRFFIVRISWVFGKTEIILLRPCCVWGRQKRLNVVSDQVGSPTYTADIAPLLADMIQTDKYGLYHACNGGTCSWAELAREIFHERGWRRMFIPFPQMNILQKPNGPVIPGSADGRWKKRNLSCLNRGRTLSENIFMVIWDYKNYKRKNRQAGRQIPACFYDMCKRSVLFIPADGDLVRSR